jgi:UDP-N-acetylglucosamine acyltransferase
MARSDRSASRKPVARERASAAPRVDRTASVDPGAQLGPGVEVGPHAVIEDHVTIGAGTWIGPHAVIEEWTTLGADCRVHPGAVLGGAPQDRHFAGERSYLRVGDRVTFREHVTVSRATGEGAETVIGDDTQMLAYSHAGHNCQIGRQVIITNFTQLSGHVVVEDRVVFSGMAGVIQFARIGTLAMVTGLTRILKDVPPYMLVEGDPLRIVAPNRVGLQRAGISPEIQLQLRRAHRFLVRSGLDVSHALERIERELGGSEEVRHFVLFIRDSQARGMGIGR